MRLFFGGTFDPVHLGHVQGALAAADALAVAQVDMVLSARPSHRDQPGGSIEQRLAMLDIACNTDSRLATNSIEVERDAPSFTVETLRELRASDAHTPFGWVVGADAYHYLTTWYCWEEVFELAHLVVLARAGHRQPPAQHVNALQALEAKRLSAGVPDSAAGSLLRVQVSLPDISATQIRRRVAAGYPVAHLLPNGVADYLRAEGLYTARSTNPQ